MQESRSTAIAQDISDSESIEFPSTFDDWEDWNRIAFQRANSQIFLNLATWLLLRFRQLTGMSLDDDVDGLLIPDHPGCFDIEDDANYNEALGMTGLYSALAHIDTHPQYLSHIFHEVGKASAEGRLGSSHPGVRSVPELPTPVLRYVNFSIYVKTYSSSSMLPTEQYPWLKESPPNDDDGPSDQDADFEVDSEHGDVSTAFNDMDISGAPASTDPANIMEVPKRKRTLSSTLSPPKVNNLIHVFCRDNLTYMDYFQQADGGRGFPKRSKGHASQSFIRPKSPIPTSNVRQASIESTRSKTTTSAGTHMHALPSITASVSPDPSVIKELEMSRGSDTSPDLQIGTSDIGSWDESGLDTRMRVSSVSEERGTSEPLDDVIDDSSGSGVISKADTGVVDMDDCSAYQGECVDGAMEVQRSTSQSSVAIPSKLDEDVRILVLSTPP
jgi:hypothetical protein